MDLRATVRTPRGVTAILSPFVRGHLWPLIAIVVLQTAAAAAVLALPTLNARVIDDGLLHADLGATAQLAIVMLVVTIVHLLVSALSSLVSSRTAAEFSAGLREKVVDSVATATTGELARFTPGTILTRATGDVQQLQTMLQMSLTTIITAPIMLVGAVVISVTQHSRLAWLIAATACALVIVVFLFAAATVPESRRMQRRTDRVTSILREQVSGFRPIRMFLREDHESSRFRSANEALVDSSWRVSRYMVGLPPILALITNGATLLVLWLSADDVVDGALSIGGLLAFIAYLTYVLSTASSAILLVMVVPPAQVSARRIIEVLDATGRCASRPGEPAPTRVDQLRIADVSCGFSDAAVISGVSFEVARGELVAVVGSTGAGKSTLMRMLAGLLEPDDGTIVGEPSGLQLTAAARRDSVSFVPQTPYLTEGTLREAITLDAPDRDDDAALRAIDVAQAGDVVTDAGGLDAAVAPGGANFSGGQRQRLSLARALATGRPFVIIDDALAAVDGDTEREILDTLREETGRGAVIVTQRMSVAARADRIVVLERGALVGYGTFDDLLRTCTEFQQLFMSQRAMSE